MKYTQDEGTTIVNEALEREERTARRIAEAVVRHRLREESLSDEEREELVEAVYQDQLERRRAKRK